MQLYGLRYLNMACWLVLLLVTGVPAYGAHGTSTLSGSDFEIDDDANLVVNHPDDGIDWNAASVTYRIQEEEFIGANDDAFGQGSKEDSPVPSTVTGSIPPNKSDLTSFGLYMEDKGLGSRFLHMFWTRVQDPSGTTNMDFEFNQRGLNQQDLSDNGVTPIRSYLDMLIQYDLENGGTVPKLYLSFWLDGSEGTTATECEASSKLPCWGRKQDLSNAGIATGSINSSPINDPMLGSLDPRTFGEASIDFGLLMDIVNSNSCFTFGSAYLKSRSSDSFTSSLKDYVAPLEQSVSNCASIKIIKRDEVGTPLQGVVFELFADNAPTGGDYNASDEDGTTALDSCQTDANGECTISGVFPGYYWVIEKAETIPTGHTGQAPMPVLIDGPGDNETVTATNTRKPASVQIIKKDDAGAALAGAKFVLFVDEDKEGDLDEGETTENGNCTTAANGTCTISNILPPGHYCLDETVVPTNYSKGSNMPLCFELGLDEKKTVNVVNNRLPSKVTINKKDDNNTVLKGAEFTLYTDVNSDGSLNGGDTKFDACSTGDSGSCTINNILPAGKYCIDETQVPTGHTKDSNFPQCFSIGLNDTKTFNAVNPRKPAKVEINKTDDASPANALQGAGFTLYTDSNNNGSLDGTDPIFNFCTTDASGSCSILNVLPAGKYCLDETTVPAGYTKDSSFPQCFELALDQTKTVNSVNPRKRGAIKITKTRDHAATGANVPHAGVTFTLKDPDGTEVGSGTTDTKGEFCVDNVLFSSFLQGDGKYVATETVPSGYTADSTNPQSITVDSEGSCETTSHTLSFHNSPLTDFTISVDSQVEGGTRTEIVCDNGNGSKTIIADSPTDGDGSHLVTNLEPGTYSCTLTISDQ